MPDVAAASSTYCWDPIDLKCLFQSWMVYFNQWCMQFQFPCLLNVSFPWLKIKFMTFKFLFSLTCGTLFQGRYQPNALENYFWNTCINAAVNLRQGKLRNKINRDKSEWFNTGNDNCYSSWCLWKLVKKQNHFVFTSIWFKTELICEIFLYSYNC